jgi:hypothetical protein
LPQEVTVPLGLVDGDRDLVIRTIEVQALTWTSRSVRWCVAIADIGLR